MPTNINFAIKFVLIILYKELFILRMIMRGNPTPEFFDYIACKFIVNLPKEELGEDRIGFHF